MSLAVKQTSTAVRAIDTCSPPFAHHGGLVHPSISRRPRALWCNITRRAVHYAKPALNSHTMTHLVAIVPALAAVGATKADVEVHDSTMAATTQRAAR